MLRFWANLAVANGFTAFEGELLNCDEKDEKFIFWYCEREEEEEIRFYCIERETRE